MFYNNNLTESVFLDNNVYKYKGVELTPYTFAHVLVFLFDGKQFKRGDVVKEILDFHKNNGGIAEKKEYYSVFKNATRKQLKNSLRNPGYGIWELKYKEEQITPFVPELSGEKGEIFDIDEVCGRGKGSVYIYYYDIYREIATLQGKTEWPCKVGMSNKDTIARIFSQSGTAFPEYPHIALLIKCDSAREMERALHSILKVQGKWLKNSPGKEWFMTSPNEIKKIYNVLFDSAD